MALVVRTDLGMGKGKTASQVAHAAVTLALRGPNRDKVRDWMIESPSQTKVVLKVDSVAELNLIADRCELHGVHYTIIQDAGRTQIEPGSVTVLGIGPEEIQKIDAIVGTLKLL